MTLARRWAPALLLVAILALVGCASNGPSFKDQFRSQSAGLSAVSAKLSYVLLSLSSTNAVELRRELDGLATTLEGDLRKLANLGPPRSLLATYGVILAAGARVATDLRAIAAAATAGTAAGARTAAHSLVSDGQQLSAAVHKVEAAVGLPPS